MARPLDPQRHRQRQLSIIDAALTRFAADGYTGATTAAICRTAGIGSGTFFHYFPTKVDVLLGVLALGTEEAVEFFAGHEQAGDPVAVLLAYVEHETESLRDERAAGFIRAVGAVAAEARVEAALHDHERVVSDALRPWVVRSREETRIRTDLSVDQTIRWILALVDGFAAQVADGRDFDARREGPVLLDAVERFLRPGAPS